MKKVICIGSATKDIFLPIDKAKVVENPESLTEKKLMAFEYGAKLYASEIIETLGGTAVNVAAGLTRSGYTTYVFSRTSSREIGKWILKQIGRLKIKKNYMQQHGVGESEVSVIILDKTSIEHIIFRTGDSVEMFDLKKALSKYNEKVDWIFVGSLKRGWQEKMKEVSQFADEKKALIAFNPSGYQITNDAKDLPEYFAKAEVVQVNRDEAIEILQKLGQTVEDRPEDILQGILGLGCQTVVVTDAENGAYVGNENERYYLPTEAVKKVDSVGAGDSFGSGFLSSYIEKKDIKQALCWGIANSASVVSKIGGISGLLGKKELAMAAEKIMSKVMKLK